MALLAGCGTDNNTGNNTTTTENGNAVTDNTDNGTERSDVNGVTDKNASDNQETDIKNDTKDIKDNDMTGNNEDGTVGDAGADIVDGVEDAGDALTGEDNETVR
jgi:hypothetical protein